MVGERGTGIEGDGKRFVHLDCSSSSSNPYLRILRSAIAWMRAIISGCAVLAEQMREAFLRLQIFLDRQLVAYLQHAGDDAMLGLEYREQTGFLRQPRDADGVMRGRAPAQRAGHEDVDVARAANAIARFTLYSRSRRSATVAVAT